MADGVWKFVYPYIFGCSRQFSLNKLFDPSTSSMRKGCDREKETGEKEKRMMKIVATMSFTAVDRRTLTAERWNAASSCQ